MRLSTTSELWHAAPTQAPGSGGSDEGDTLQRWSSLIGIITAIVGNMLIALALNVQRYAHTRLHKERVRNRHRARSAMKRAKTASQSGGLYGAVGADGPRTGITNGNDSRNGDSSAILSADEDGDARSPGEPDPLAASYQSGTTSDSDLEDLEDTNSTYLKSPYWWLGQILITLGEMGNFLAYGFAPASIVSPLGVVALISNCIIAPAMFHEQFRQRDFWGVVIAVAGAVTVVLSAKQEEVKLDPHAVWDAITTLAFEVYLGVTILLIAIMMWVSSWYGKESILIDLGLVGLFGGYTALATKGVSSMLSSTLWRAFTTPVTYALIFIILVTAIMQIRYVNKALQRFDSTQVIPIQFVMFTLCVILGSAVLYRDFEKTTAEQAAKFVGGCLLTFFGVFLITSGRQQREDDDEDLLSEADGVEETIGLAQHEGEEPSSPISKSRRSSRISRVSFAETIKPHTPLDQPDIPSLRYPPAESNRSSLDRESSPLLHNAWQTDWEEAASPPRGVRTLSADSMPIASPGAAIPAAHSHPATPLRDGLSPLGYPTAEAMTSRPLGPSRTMSHHRASTFINPSPLSSTVTTVVKDAFLRAYDDRHAQQSSLRRIRSSIRASLFFNDDEDILEQAVESDDTLTRTLTGGDGTSSNRQAQEADLDDPMRRRSRSVSDTIGDFFRPKRKKAKALFPSDVESSAAAGEGSNGGDESEGSGSTATPGP